MVGEKITDRGIGNGISLIIMIGIIAALPGSLMAEFATALESQGGGLVMFLVEMVALLAGNFSKYSISSRNTQNSCKLC